MKLAAIDIGTNAVLLLVAEREEGRVEEVLDVSTITRLGEGLTRTRRLMPAAMERTVKVLEKYRTVLDDCGAQLVACFGTSAVREAENRAEFISAVRNRSGITVRVFSEYEEAFYTYLSVKSDPAIPGDDLVIVDIGGGSTEIARASRERFLDYVSLPVGTVKLTELFVRHDPPSPEELQELRRFVRDKLPPQEEKAGLTIVGMAGTMTTLAALVLGLDAFDKAKIHGFEITLSTLDEWIERLGRMSAAQRRALPGMEPGREDLLLQGMILMKEIVASFHARGFVVSTYGARYGVMYEKQVQASTS